MENEVDYESLPDASGLTAHMLSGAIAGIAEHSIMFPVDCVKTRMMALVPDPKANYRNLFQALARIVSTEGALRPLRGVSAMLGGAGPAHAMYFACYEKVKKTLSETSLGPGAISQGAAGACATVCHDAIMNPADVIKQRMQMFGSRHTACVACGRAVMKDEGARAFYRSFTTQLTMNIPFQSLHFIIYERCQDWLNDERAWNPRSHVISGGIAGGVAAAVTTPFDVCKTLLNTQERCAISNGDSSISGLANAWRTIYRLKGVRGYFSGIQARVIYQIPSTGISWTVYELFKHYLLDTGEGQPSKDCPVVTRDHSGSKPTNTRVDNSDSCVTVSRQMSPLQMSPLRVHASHDVRDHRSLEFKLDKCVAPLPR